ncbi:MAG: glycosyltransferase [Actinomycetota bacterium]
MSPEISVVVPCYNSATALPELCDRLRATLSDRSDDAYEILLVDDRSADDTWAAISRLAAAHPQVVGLRLGQNSGQHLATLRGLAEARGAVLVTMDDDLQHRPEHLPDALAALTPGTVVFACPVARTHKRWRRVASAIWNVPASLLLAKPVRLRLVAFRVFDRSVCERLLRTPARRPMVSTMLLRAADEVRAVQTAAGEAQLPSRYSTTDLLRIATAYSSGVSVSRLRLIGSAALGAGVALRRGRPRGARLVAGAGAAVLAASHALALARRRGTPVVLPDVAESTRELSRRQPAD